MSTWIFQSRPDQFDFSSEVAEGETVPWWATRYRADMKPGDKVVFWVAGPEDKRGVYGLGRIENEPTSSQGDDVPRVNVKVERKLEKPVTVRHFRNNAILKDMQIMKIPIGTNFRLDKDEEAELAHMPGIGIAG